MGTTGLTTLPSHTRQSIPAKLQLLTLSAKLLVLAHCSSSFAHLRPLALLFDYLTLLARYDLAYEVRDRARFLAGLIQSGGIGKLKREGGGSEEEHGLDGARMMLEEDDFRKGVMVEDLAGENGQQNGDDGEDASEKQSLTSEQVRAVLFEGKAFGATTGELVCNPRRAITLSDRLTPAARSFSRRPVDNLGRCSARHFHPLSSRQATLPCRTEFAICPPRVPDQCPAVHDSGPPGWFLSLPGRRRLAVLFSVQHADAGVRIRFVRFVRFVGQDAPRRRRRERRQGRPRPGFG